MSLPEGSGINRSSTAISSEERRARGYRLGFRVDAETKKQVERAAALERRSLTDFCLTAIAGLAGSNRPS